MKKKSLPNLLGRSLHGFFVDYLPQLRGLSPHTIRSYRDAFVLLVRFVSSQKNCTTTRLDLNDLDTEQIINFLRYLERDRHNIASTRNIRLAAIHTFFNYVSAHHPDRIQQSQRILSIPFKRTRHRSIDYLEYDELEAVLSAVDRLSFDGRRDYALLAVMFNTGARVQEIIQIRGHDLQLQKPFQVRIVGKGRKERFCPLWQQTAQILQALCNEREIDLHSEAPVFVNHRGDPLTRFGVRYILTKYFQVAQTRKSTLAKKNFHPHVIRHSTAMHLLKAGVDLVTISHWLGHTNVNTTNKYITMNLEAKRKAIEQAKPDSIKGARNWKRDSSIISWLEAL
ncbi:site-specific integrase [bacterium]|nr:site-specific integrase [bacterium]